ncbi:MAG: alpha/beta hydrolase [Oscillospiraceae bacterium]|nr:alpha/beta hydrolase [Oscillospiraceae bacterium]
MHAAGIVLAAVVLLLLICFGNTRIRLGLEENLLTPPGTLVDVDGGRMHVYTEGSGNETLVFLSGGGTCSPVLDFKSLYSLLSGDFRIAVVEKFGYGYSGDSGGRFRDTGAMLEDTRSALLAAGVEGPYVLCPHSMSGLEALRWAQKYPGEVTAIIGLDMAVPEAYEDMPINMFALRLGRLAVDAGIARLIPGLAEGDAVRYGTLTEAEKTAYQALFYRRTASPDMLAEAAAVKDNAKAVAAGGIPQVPMLLFISDGSGGTGFSEEVWRGFQRDYLSGVENGQSVELDCPHYVHDHEYQRISVEIKNFLAVD